MKVSSSLHGSGSRHISRHLRRLLQYSDIGELHHRMFQDVAPRGCRNYERLSTDFGPCCTIFHLPLGGHRECWLVSVPFVMKAPWCRNIKRFDRLFGMMAFFCVFATMVLGVVIWKGPALRLWNLEKDATEDGVKIISSDRSSSSSIEN